MPSRGEVWWAFGAEPSPVVILSSRDETDLRAIHVVPAAETDISGVAIELPVGREEGLPSGVVRVALARQDRINCAWLVSLKETDLNERAGALSEEKLSKLAEILRLGGLEVTHPSTDPYRPMGRLSLDLSRARGLKVEAVQTAARENVTCVTPLGDETVSTS